MAGVSVFIIYDFQIKGGLVDNFAYVAKRPPEGFAVNYPNPATGMSQGEIWRNIVKPQLESADRIIAFIDLPNANVGFEIGYAIGYNGGKKTALALYKNDIPTWLIQPPFKGFSCKPITDIGVLSSQVQSDELRQLHPILIKTQLNH
jgi:hypothetical protein